MKSVYLSGSGSLAPSAGAILLVMAFLFFFHAQAQRMAVVRPPSIIVWAWHRDEDLSYIDAKKVAVAYLAGTIFIRGSSVRFRPCDRKLKMPPGTNAYPVFRIETIRSLPTHSSTESAIKTAENDDIPTVDAASFAAKTIADHSSSFARNNVSSKSVACRQVQIDFDAFSDERTFYRELLRRLRHELPSGCKISITVLASWLLADRWLEPACADEAVAMLFSMGPGKREVLSSIRPGALNSGAGIPIALGISANEKSTNRALFERQIQKSTGHLYIFSSRPWTQERLRAITSEAQAR